MGWTKGTRVLTSWDFAHLPTGAGFGHHPHEKPQYWYYGATIVDEREPWCHLQIIPGKTSSLNVRIPKCRCMSMRFKQLSFNKMDAMQSDCHLQVVLHPDICLADKHGAVSHSSRTCTCWSNPHVLKPIHITSTIVQWLKENTKLLQIKSTYLLYQIVISCNIQMFRYIYGG